MRAVLVEHLVTIRGSATAVTSVTQDARDWRDFAGWANAIFWLEVAEVATPDGVVQLELQTSPSRDEALFRPMMPAIALSAGTSVSVHFPVQSLSTAFLARWVRWRLSTTATSNGSWSAMFRIWATLSRKTPFVPTELSGCLVWLRGDLGITLNGSDVSAWADQSGNGSNFQQTTAAKQPVYLASDAGLGGKAGLSFTAANSETLESVSSLTYGPFTAFAVITPLATATTHVWSRSDGVDDVDYLYGAQSAAIVVNRGGTKSAKDSSDASWSTLSGTKTVVQTFDGTHAGHTLYINGTDKTGGSYYANNPGTATAAEKLFIASVLGVASFATFKLAEFILYNRALSSTERQQVEMYLRARYAHY